MKRLLLFITFLNLISFSALSQSNNDVKEKNIEVVLGIDKIEKLFFAPSTKVQIGNESILTYQIIPAKREITFKGLKPGKTSVTVRNTVGDIKARFLVVVTVNDQSKVVKELKEFLQGVQGLEVGIKGKYVYVGGNIVVPSDIGKIVIILDKYPEVINLVELSPHSQRIIAKEMQEEIQKNGMRDVTVRVVNKLFWLEGIVTSEGLKVRAEKIAVAYVPDRIESLARRTGAVQTARGRNPIQNFISVNEKKKSAPLPKMIKISAQFVELTKDYNRIFGFKWQPTLSGDGGQITFGKTENGGVVTRSSGTLGGTIAGLFPKLGSAKQAGYARVIQSGVILIQEGKTGKINKESEKSFALTNEFTQAAKAKAGFNLTVTPKILKEEKITLDMGISVSSSTGSPPEVLSNTISTSMVVKSKESAVVGGIVINTSSTSFDKDHPFGEEAADSDSSSGGTTLFSFIRSKSYQTTRSQFAVFVTPEIVESASSGTDKIKRKFRRRRR